MGKKVSDVELQRARLWALVLPEAERRGLERHYGVRPAALSAALALLIFPRRRIEERRDGPWTAFAYILEPYPENENFLGIVHTDAELPVDSPAADAMAGEKA